jgi:hypothetical protein
MAVPQREQNSRYPAHNGLGAVLPESDRLHPSKLRPGRSVIGLRFEHVRVEARKADQRPLMLCDDIKDLNVSSLDGDPPASSQPLLVLRNVRRAFIRGCCAPPHLATLLSAEGDQCSDNSLIANDLMSAAAVPVRAFGGAPRDAISLTGNKTRGG